MMESDNELPEDEEETLVYVEFEDFVNSNMFNNEQLKLDMIGIDTEHPIMQINGRFFEGTYEDAIGTYMFFGEDKNAVVDDPVFDRVPTLKYLSKTRKVLKMHRVFVKHRTEVLGDSEHSSCIPNKETIKLAGVPPKYQDEALSFWEKIRNDRLNALNIYLEKQKIREEKILKGIVPDSESDEDNPFAVYKQKEFESTKKFEDLVASGKKDACSNKTQNSEKHLALKDVKFAMPNNDKSCTETGVEEKRVEPRKVVRKKKQGKISLVVSKKKCKKKQISVKSVDCTLKTDKVEASKVENTSNENVTTKIDQPENSNAEQIDDIPELNNRSEIKDDASNIKTDISQENIIINKKLRKHSKQEAKMKEISEQLKLLATEEVEKRTVK